jgi:CRP/FNR family transcriptional regulator
MARRRLVRAGGQIFGPNPNTPVVANIISGVVRLSKSLGDGRTQIVGLQFAPEFIGQPFASDGLTHAEAATTVELCCFTKSQFESLLHAHRELQELLFVRIAQDLDLAREWMLLLGHKSAEERVASLILLCADKSSGGRNANRSEAGDFRLELPLSRTEMAEFLGLTPETVSRTLRRLVRSGVIAIHNYRGLTIIDAAELRARAERAEQ